MRKKSKYLLVIVAIMCLMSACTKNSGVTGSKTDESTVTNETDAAGNGETDANTIPTSQLIDEALQYVKDEPMSVDVWEQAEFALDYWVKNCDAVSELIERDDYAELIMDIYMDSELPPYEATDSNLQDFRMMEFEEVMLSQDSACSQLSESRQKELVKQIACNAQRRIAEEAYVLYYASAFFKNIEWQGTDNAWYNTIKEMERTGFSDEENQYIDNFYDSCDGAPQPVD